MPRVSEATEFSFISYKSSTLPEDAAVRAVIRQHAMRNVATTRHERKNYGHNHRQNEIIYISNDGTHVASSNTLKLASKNDNTNLSQDHEQVILYPQPMSYHDAEIRNCFSRMNLIAPIAGLHLGIATLSRFATEENLVGDVFRAPLPFSKLDSRQLLSFIPSRYATVSSITHAINCLAARLEQIMSPEVFTIKEELVILQQYTTALRSLQEAIDDEDQRMTPETLCATELLGIFELLSGRPDQKAWARHVAGTAQLIKVRGPHRFQTDFELALFMAHIGPMVVEAFLHNKRCFIVEEPWQQVMYAAIHSDPSIPKEQRGLVYELWSHIVNGPNVFLQVADLILSSTTPSEDAIQIIVECLQRDQEHLNMWLGMARDLELIGSAAERHGVFFTPSLWSGSACSNPPERILCPVLQGTFLMCYIMKARLLSSISPSLFYQAEVECQALADEILSLEADPSVYEDGGIFAGLFLSQTAWVARAIRNTKDLWAESFERATGNNSERSTIEIWKFEKWCTELREDVNFHYAHA